MQIAANLFGAYAQAVPANIKENSIIVKVISFMPVPAAMLIQLCIELSLGTQIERAIGTFNAPRAIELINLKNQFKAIGAAREVLTAALIVAGIASGVIINCAGSIAITLSFIGLAGAQAYLLHKNCQFVNDLRARGIRFGMGTIY